MNNVVSSSVNKWRSLWGVSGSVTRGGSVGDWMVTFCKCLLSDQYVEEFKMVIFTLKLKRPGIKNLNVASVIAYLSQWLCGSSSFRSPWWSGGLLVRAPVGTALACLVVLLDPHSLHILYQIFCQWHLRKLILLFCFVHVTPTACLSILGERSLLCGSSWAFFYLLSILNLSQYGKFFISWIKGLRTEDDIYSKDYKAHWGTVIVI